MGGSILYKGNNKYNFMYQKNGKRYVKVAIVPDKNKLDTILKNFIKDIDNSFSQDHQNYKKD